MRSLWSLMLVGSVLMAGCTSEVEKQLITACLNQYERGRVDDNTGKRIAPRWDTMVFGVCRTKVELHLAGYRVQPFVEDGDILVLVMKDRNGLSGYYIKKLECESNPTKCK